MFRRAFEMVDVFCKLTILFADTPKGAEASAIYCSLIESAKANGLEPYDYLNRVLQGIGSADTLEKLEVLLPWNIK